MIKFFYSTEFSKLYFSLNAPLWKQQIHGDQDPLHFPLKWRGSSSWWGFPMENINGQKRATSFKTQTTVKCLTPVKCAVKCVVWVLNDVARFLPLMLSIGNPHRELEPLHFKGKWRGSWSDSRLGSYPWKSILHGHDVILREQGGVLVMENPFKYGVTGGCLLNIHPWSSHRLLMFCWILRQDNRTMTCWMDSLFPKWPISSGASPYLVLKQKTNYIDL